MTKLTNQILWPDPHTPDWWLLMEVWLSDALAQAREEGAKHGRATALEQVREEVSKMLVKQS